MAAEAENLRLCWRYWVGERDLDRLNSLVDGLWALYEGRGWYGATVELASDLLAVLASTPGPRSASGSESTLRMSQARALMAMEGYTSAVEAEYAHALDSSRAQATARQLLPGPSEPRGLYNYRAEFDKAAQIGT